MTVKVREVLQNKEPYESFDDPTKLRLGTNENPNPISDKIAKEIGDVVSETIKSANRYPQDQMVDLRKSLSNFIKKTTDLDFDYTNIICGNGSSEILLDLYLAFGGPDRTALTFPPSYMMYSQYARESHTKIVQCPRNDDFSINVEAVKKAISQYLPTLVPLVNPNNPTGNFTPFEDIEEILEYTKTVTLENGGKPLIIIDEAYIEFIKPTDKSAIELVNKYDNLCVIRTLSKAFSFAGVRFGYLIGNKEIVDAVRLVRLPYCVSSITQIVAKTILPHSDEMLAKVDEIKSTRNDLFEFLSKLTFRNEKLILIPSSSNFIQIGFPPIFEDYIELPQQIVKYIYDKGIVIRNVGPQGYFRISIGTQKEVDLLKIYFKEFLDANE